MAENKIDYFTREGSAAITEADLGSVRAKLRAKVSGAKRAGENLVEAAAYATHAAIRVQDDWTPTKWVEATGAARGTVYLWKRMGIAIMDLGIEPKSPEWTALVGKSAATKSPVTWVLDGKGEDGKGDGTVAPTREALDRMLSVLFERDENGVLLPSQAKSGKDIKAEVARLKGEDAATETGDGADDSNGVESVDMFTVLAKSLKFAADNLDLITDRAQFESLVPMIREINVAAKNVDKATKVADAS